jgi:hypothetical protein
MTSQGRHQTTAELVTPFTALGQPLPGIRLAADHRVVNLCAVNCGAEPFAT